MTAPQGRFKLDGKSYEQRSAVVAGEFDIDPEDLESVNYDDTLVLIVIGRVGPPTFKETSSGDLKRVDKIQLGATPQVRVAKGETGGEIADMYGLEVAQQFEVGDPDPFREVASGGEGSADPEPDPEPEPQPEPEPAPAKSAKKASKAKKAPAKKSAAKKAAAVPVVPPSPDVGRHVGGANANDEKLRDFLAEPVS